MSEVNLDDPDNPEWTEEDFKRARPAAEVMGAEFAAKLVRKRPSVTALLVDQHGWLTERIAA